MLTRGHSVFTPVFSSPLAPAFSRYIDLKRALGRRFDLPARTLQSLDRFLHDQNAKYPDLNAAAFRAWSHTHEHVSSGVRRIRMLEVCSFCLYRRRTELQCFVPDPAYSPHIINGSSRTFFRARSGKSTPRRLRLEAESVFAGPPGDDSSRDCSVVHHGNAARRTAGFETR